MWNSVQRLRCEVRAMGIATLGLPLVVVAVFLGVSLLAVYDVNRTSGGTVQAHHDFAQGLLYLVEFGIPPVAGLIGAYLITHDPAKELHLSLARAYAATMLLRLAIFTLWTIAVCAAISRLGAAAGFWLVPRAAPLDQLAWLAPLLWFTMGGTMLALLLRSGTGASAILGMLWLGELLLRPFFLQNAVLQKTFLFLTMIEPRASFWLANRLTLVGMAVVFLVLAALLLRRNEAILGHEV
jgi:hypothetical protein